MVKAKALESKVEHIDKSLTGWSDTQVYALYAKPHIVKCKCNIVCVLGIQTMVNQDFGDLL